MPRVGFGQLKSFVGRSVIFVGRVESMEGGVVVMQAPDGSHVHVQASSSFDTPFVEVTGVVVDPQTIREESHVDYGDSFGACERARCMVLGGRLKRRRGLCGSLCVCRHPID